MINCNLFLDSLLNNDINFYTGVPDSLLKDICGYINDNTDKNQHIIATNEGSAVGLAIGYHLATGKVPLVYLQNSGIGNLINPLLSLADKEVYGIPIILMIGWRGEPGVKDEPQHIKQGKIQNSLLETLQIHYQVIDNESEDFEDVIERLKNRALLNSEPVALIVRSGTFTKYKMREESSIIYEITREEAIESILESDCKNSIIVSTTGKTSREVFEYRFKKGESHKNDFLTVGGMGHANQIAYGLALNSKRRIICLDGDGAVLMHMGSICTIGNSQLNNFIHVVINNGAHESVGGQPTLGFSIDLVTIAKSCGYKEAFQVSSKVEIHSLIANLDTSSGPVLIEIRTNKGSRDDLGRPTKSPKENKIDLMKNLNDHNA